MWESRGEWRSRAMARARAWSFNWFSLIEIHPFLSEFILFESKPPAKRPDRHGQRGRTARQRFPKGITSHQGTDCSRESGIHLFLGNLEFCIFDYVANISNFGLKDKDIQPSNEINNGNRLAQRNQIYRGRSIRAPFANYDVVGLLCWAKVDSRSTSYRGQKLFSRIVRAMGICHKQNTTVFWTTYLQFDSWNQCFPWSRQPWTYEWWDWCCPKYWCRWGSRENQKLPTIFTKNNRQPPPRQALGLSPFRRISLGRRLDSSSNVCSYSQWNRCFH